MELLDIVDENGCPTGETVERGDGAQKRDTSPYLPCLADA